MTTTGTVERRAESLRAIRDLVANRTQMLALYAELAAQRPYFADEATTELVQSFCQSLVDYTAEAHFRLYRHFENNNERRTPVAEIATQVYPQIADKTQAILDFNDKYDSEDSCRDISRLESDLSVVGEVLAERIELEDRLISALSKERR